MENEIIIILKVKTELNSYELEDYLKDVIASSGTFKGKTKVTEILIERLAKE